MTIDQAANFLVGCILVGLGFTVLTVFLVFLNNILHKYWRPIELGHWLWPVHYPENVESTVENEKGAKNERRTGQTKT